MNKVIFLFLSLFSLLGVAQVSPEKGDYVMKTSVKNNSGSYIYKTAKVYYGYDFSTKRTENEYKQNKKITGELFDLLNKTDFSKIKGIEELKVPDGDDSYNFCTLEYRKGDKVQRICWDTRSEEKQYQSLNDIVTKMNSFW